MKKVLLAATALTLVFSTSCVRPTKECNYATNRPECENCCVKEGMKYYDYINVDSECYCEDI